jgi:hypothetical protein
MGKKKKRAKVESPEERPRPRRPLYEEDEEDEEDIDSDESHARHFHLGSIAEEASQVHLGDTLAFASLAEALGTRDTDFIWGLVKQIIGAAGGYDTGDAIGFVLALIKDAKPKTHLARMLLAQMAVSHLATMRCYKDLWDDGEDRAFALKALASFTRIFTAQMSTLNRHVNGGEQRVVVRHVSMSGDAQTLFGNVNPRPAIEETQTAVPKLMDARQPAIEPLPQQEAVSVRSKGASNE